LHQVLNGALHIIAEPAADRVGMPEVAPEEADRELLIELRRGIRVSQRLEEVAVDRPGIAADQLRGGPAGFFGCAGLRLEDELPLARHVIAPPFRSPLPHPPPPPAKPPEIQPCPRPPVTKPTPTTQTDPPPKGKKSPKKSSRRVTTAAIGRMRLWDRQRPL